MKLTYNFFKKENIDTEIEKIKPADEIELKIDPKDKELLFLLGILFAAGKKITIGNKENLDFATASKSFYIMSYVWELFSDSNFPNLDFSNVNTDLEKLVENIKRLGFKVQPIVNNPADNKLFLICPVRSATEEQKKEIENFVAEKESEGLIIHAPHLHTVQHDLLGGYTICMQNANAVAASSEIDLYYDQKSAGSVFDLGVAYYLEKPLRLLNSDAIEFDDDDFGDYVIKNWPYKTELSKLVHNRNE